MLIAHSLLQSHRESQVKDRMVNTPTQPFFFFFLAPVVRIAGVFLLSWICVVIRQLDYGLLLRVGIRSLILVR